LFIIAANVLASRLAPPTKTPSTSEKFTNDLLFSAWTLPPYNTGEFRFCSDNNFFINKWASIMSRSEAVIFLALFWKVEIAEKKYIDIIAADPRNIEAFEGLGDLYYEQGMFSEAKETFKHVLKLDPSSATAAYDLAHISKEEGDVSSARTYIRQALSREPKNVKYLDLDIELALEAKDKLGAQESIAVVRAVNPDNQKLDSWDEKLIAL